MISDTVSLIRQTLREALPLQQAIQYTRGWNREQYDKAFGGKYRIFLPLDHVQIDLSDLSPDSIEIPRAIYLATYHSDFDSLSPEEYVRGVITKDGRIFRLGRVLQRLDPSGKLLGIFNGDVQRTGANLTGKDLMLVISRHPYDIAGMSTDRGWTSCMELPNPRNRGGGCYHDRISSDIKLGTLIAYLARKEDTNLQHPIGRTLIKPYYASDNKHFQLIVSENVYGFMPENVHHEVRKWVKKNQNVLSNAHERPYSSFLAHPDLYQDSDEPDLIADQKALQQLADVISNDDVKTFSGWVQKGLLDINEKQPDPYLNNSPEPLVTSVINKEAWAILEFMIDQPEFGAWEADSVPDNCPQNILDKLVLRGYIKGTQSTWNIRKEDPVLQTFIRLQPHNPQLTGSLLKAINQYCAGDFVLLSLVEQMLKAGVSLESPTPLVVYERSRKKRLESVYIYDIVATKSYPEVVGMKITLEAHKSLLSLLRQHGGERHSQQPRVVVFKPRA